MRTFVFRLSGVCVLALALACDSGSTGPGTKGPEFFKATIDREVWVPQVVLASCGETNLGFIAGRPALPPGSQESMLIRISVPVHLGIYVLGDSSTGRSASFVRTLEPGSSVWFNSTSEQPGQANITGLSFPDSIVAGTFRFNAVSATDPTEIRRISGSFRAKWMPVYTVEHPDGTTCAPPPD